MRKSGLNFLLHAGDVFADLLVGVDRVKAEEDCFLRAMLLAEADHHGVFDRALDLRIARGLSQPQRGERAGEGLIRLLHQRVGPGDGHQVLRFIALVLDFAPDGERLKVEIEGLLRLANVGVVTAHVVEGHGFAAAAAGLAKDGQRLGVEVESFGGLAEIGIGAADVAERQRLAAAVAHLAPDGQGLVVVVERRLVLAEVAIEAADVVER